MEASDVASRCVSGARLALEHRHFTIDGPNGRHLCLVLPVLGPSITQLSSFLDSRMNPSFARRAAYQAVQAPAELHAQGLCHGDMTTSNIAFSISDIDQYSEEDLVRLFGMPETTPLETESGEKPGPEAPPYIVKPLNFLASEENIISQEIHILDFDHSFSIIWPPKEVLGTPAEWLAPEVAVGQPASPASDVWVLGCSIYRMRSGEGPFAGIDVFSPCDVLRRIACTLGDNPASWRHV
ncbi:kinase-like protein [Parathielavia hyrcaniae]|uniref:Kinase-like protein n=1 Tax=Parathielavia hyrcaniae TaxID=113614 RepID=A0AAN6Q0X9_9PEZI|nr:kinase-like protein [Parathielavia hyrcaniae]